jgi:hypothetical protein
VQTAAGLACVALGVLHFVDRDRVQPHARSYYFGTMVPRTPGVRALLALVEVAVGFALLFTS